MAVGPYPVIAGVLLIVTFGLSKYGYVNATPSEIVACDSNCRFIADKFNHSTAWNKNRCNDFYKYACGKSSQDVRQRYEMQENYVKDFLEKSVGDISSPDRSLTREWNDPVLQLMQKYYKTCSTVKTAGVTELKSIIELLRQTLVETRVQEWDVKNKIILTLPHTTCYQNDHKKKCTYIIDRLVAAGLPNSLKMSLIDGCMNEHKLYDVINDQNVRPKTEIQNQYPGYNLFPSSDWNVVWNKQRTNKQWIWPRYLKNYWKRSVQSPSIPSLREYEFDGFIEFPDLITAFGATTEKLDDLTMQHIIQWRMISQLVEYQVQDGQEVLIPTACRIFGTDVEQQKDIWYRVFLQSLKNPIKKVFNFVDLSTKLWIYRNMHVVHNIRPEDEPLTPKEYETLLKMEEQLHEFDIHLYRVTEKMNAILREIESREEDGHCPKMKELFCQTGYDIAGDKLSHLCLLLCKAQNRRYYEIPVKKDQVDSLRIVLAVKKDQVDRTEAQLWEFKQKHAKQIENYEYLPDNKPLWLRDWIKEKQIPTFNFEKAKPVFAPLRIEELSTNSDYSDLALSIKRLQRGIQLQLRDSKEFHNFNIDITNHAFIPLLSLFKNDNFSSFNYGIVGSEIATKLIQRVIQLPLRLGDADRIHLSQLPAQSPGRPDIVIMQCGLEVAWDAYNLHTEEIDEEGVELTRNMYDEELFFLSYVNANCDTQRKDVNKMLYRFPEFCDIFSCERNSNCHQTR